MLEQWCQQQRHRLNPPTLERWQQQHGLSPSSGRRIGDAALALAAVVRAKPSAKLNSHYLERKSQLDQVSYSLLRVKDQHLWPMRAASTHQRRRSQL